MNYSTLHSLVNENIKFVSCVFSGTDLDGKNRVGSRTYTYKTNITDIAIDDLVIVECAGVSSNFNFAIVKVVAIDEEPDYSDSVNYKWVVGKVDLASFNALKAEEDLVVANVKRLEKQAKRAQLLRALEEQGITTDALKTLMIAKRI